MHRTLDLLGSSALLCVLAAVLATSAAAEPLVDVEALRSMMESLREENVQMRRQMDRMEDQLTAAQEDARAARTVARELDARVHLPNVATEGPGVGEYPSQAVWQRRMGRATVQLLDLSVGVLAAAGGSNASDDELAFLQAGGHDPNQRGFTLQQTELSFLGAVDPYFAGEVHLIYFLDRDGESQFEIEEAFVTTTRLPFELEGLGFEFEIGHFFTEFGRLNPRHPHQWQWQDQPVVNSRFLGGDGMRAPGFRAGWLTPLPWYSEIHVGLQNAKGETNPSFLASADVFDERPIGGRPFASSGVRGSDDLVHLARWVNGFDVSETVSTQIGVSGLWGPNATGSDGSTQIYGADVVMKWRPLATDHGWPFLVFEAEAMYRRYRADDFAGCLEGDAGACEPGEAPIFLEDDVFRDWGGYAQLLWGFRRGWATGLRGEYVTGRGSGFDVASGAFVDRDADPFRSTRYRVSPLLVFHPSEFSRLRLQYNYDGDANLPSNVAHSIWAGIEFSLGSHAAHTY